MPIRIIADSASDYLPPYPSGLTILPLTVSFGDEQFLDGVNLSHRQFFEKLIECDELPVIIK